MAEQWKPVVGYEGIYEVSSEGRVRSLVTRGRWAAGRILRSTPHPNGYRMVGLWKNGQREVVLVHRVVAFAFLGAPPPEHEVNHHNGDKTDNRARNLEWVTKGENRRHAYRVLGHPPVISYGGAKLDEDKVREIRRRYAEGGVTQVGLAAEYGVSDYAIWSIVNRRTWQHVTEGA